MLVRRIAHHLDSAHYPLKITHDPKQCILIALEFGAVLADCSSMSIQTLLEERSPPVKKVIDPHDATVASKEEADTHQNLRDVNGPIDVHGQAPESLSHQLRVVLKPVRRGPTG